MRLKLKLTLKNWRKKSDKDLTVIGISATIDQLKQIGLRIGSRWGINKTPIIIIVKHD